MLTTGSHLSISCVIYDTAPEILQATLASLHAAIADASSKQYLTQTSLYLINNHSDKTDNFLAICEYANSHFERVICKSGHGNLGYGLGNNLAIAETQSDFHLVLNPDVILDSDTLSEGIGFLHTHQDAVLVAPQATNEKGETEYLAKREPTPWLILLRGLNHPKLNQYFKTSLNKYAYKDRIPCTAPVEIELASGCFMLCRTKSLQDIKGFSPDYFLYFEDFDLSRRLRELGKLYVAPNMHIMHHGGNTARKGIKHIGYFLKSYGIYWRKYARQLKRIKFD